MKLDSMSAWSRRKPSFNTSYGSPPASELSSGARVADLTRSPDTSTCCFRAANIRCMPQFIFPTHERGIAQSAHETELEPIAELLCDPCASTFNVESSFPAHGRDRPRAVDHLEFDRRQWIPADHPFAHPALGFHRAMPDGANPLCTFEAHFNHGRVVEPSCFANEPPYFPHGQYTTMR